MVKDIKYQDHEEWIRNKTLANSDEHAKHRQPPKHIHAKNWSLYHLALLYYDLLWVFLPPPARWGLLNFIRAVLLLHRLRILLLHLLRFLLLAVQIPTATSRSQWALPDLNGQFQIAVGTAGPQRWIPDRSGGTAGTQPRLPDRSGHCRASTATSRSQWALPNLNRDFQTAVGTAGPQPRLPDRSGPCRTSTATSRSQWALPDLNGKNVRRYAR